MDEIDWLASTDPQAMLTFLRASGEVSERKGRLFAAACCRRIWHLLPSVYRKVVDASERYADGLATAAEVYNLGVGAYSEQTSQARELACEAARCSADLGYNSSRRDDEWTAFACAVRYAAEAAELAELGAGLV